MRTYFLGYSAVIAIAIGMLLPNGAVYAQSVPPTQQTPAPAPASVEEQATPAVQEPAAVVLPEPPMAMPDSTQPSAAFTLAPQPAASVPPRAEVLPGQGAAAVVLPSTNPAAPVAIGTAPVSSSPAAITDPADLQPTPPSTVSTEWESLLAKPGSYVWQPELAPEGQVLIVVSLPEQRAHVYRDGVRIAITTISSGSKGRETPTGSFEILQKKMMHRSNLYDDAPMPFMQRLTWDGIALHAGRIPGYPASHGCIRLPRKFAELLYGATNFGSRVLVADNDSDPTGFLVHPGPSAPVDVITGVPQGAYAQALGEVTNRYAKPMLSQVALDPSKPLREQLQARDQPQMPIPATTSGVPAFAKPIWHHGDDPAKRVGQMPLILLPQKAATAIGTTVMPAPAQVPDSAQEGALRVQDQDTVTPPPAGRH